MSRIFYLMGKSASGKDSIFKELIGNKDLDLHQIVLYTTRPIREGEADGREYHFVTKKEMEDLTNQGKVIERREYHTQLGIWYYFTVNDSSLNPEKEDYVAIGTLESFCSLKRYFGEDAVLPIYIEVEDGLRLQRALDREKGQISPKYAEMCRRFLADEQDFSSENLKAAGITRRFENRSFSQCMTEILDYIKDSVLY